VGVELAPGGGEELPPVLVRAQAAPYSAADRYPTTASVSPLTSPESP
jgi:hypothetical protein